MWHRDTNHCYYYYSLSNLLLLLYNLFSFCVFLSSGITIYRYKGKQWKPKMIPNIVNFREWILETISLGFSQIVFLKCFHSFSSVVRKEKQWGDEITDTNLGTHTSVWCLLRKRKPHHHLVSWWWLLLLCVCKLLIRKWTKLCSLPLWY